MGTILTMQRVKNASGVEMSIIGAGSVLRSIVCALGVEYLDTSKRIVTLRQMSRQEVEREEVKGVAVPVD